jgi:Protein of unknown function (DUF2607)
MKRKFTPRQQLVRVMAVALALTALVFVVQAVSHIHPDGQEQATCQLCQIAHAGILATATICVPFAAEVPTGPVEQPTLFLHQEDFSFGSPARAPPTEVLL